MSRYRSLLSICAAFAVALLPGAAGFGGTLVLLDGSGGHGGGMLPEPDTDGDGMGDAWEALQGLDAEDASDAAFDHDGDGLTALQEFAGDTDPWDVDTDGDLRTDSGAPVLAESVGEIEDSANVCGLLVFAPPG